MIEYNLSTMNKIKILNKKFSELQNKINEFNDYQTNLIICK